jgi:Domain of unknown function (DUF5122) beta-propeller
MLFLLNNILWYEKQIVVLRNKLKKQCLFFAFLCIRCLIHAQPGGLDLSFDPGVGVGLTSNGHINCINRQGDGKILAGGLFRHFANLTNSNLVRINSDGPPDTSFHSAVGADGEIHAIFNHACIYSIGLRFMDFWLADDCL